MTKARLIACKQCGSNQIKANFHVRSRTCKSCVQYNKEHGLLPYSGSSRVRPGFVYVCKLEMPHCTRYKIGRSTDPQRRLCQLRAEFSSINPSFVVLVEVPDISIEQELHKLFRSKRVTRNEIFDLTDGDIQIILQVLNERPLAID